MCGGAGGSASPNIFHYPSDGRRFAKATSEDAPAERAEPFEQNQHGEDEDGGHEFEVVGIEEPPQRDRDEMHNTITLSILVYQF